MSDHTNRIVEASAATAATSAGWVFFSHVHEVLQVAVSVAMLAWWFRLWVKNPNVNPPEKLP